jgi:hypothetical protein
MHCCRLTRLEALPCRYGPDFGTKEQLLSFLADHLPPGEASRAPQILPAAPSPCRGLRAGQGAAAAGWLCVGEP